MASFIEAKDKRGCSKCEQMGGFYDSWTKAQLAERTKITADIGELRYRNGLLKAENSWKDERIEELTQQLE